MRGHDPADGRHARRERSRLAVVEAVFELVLEGKGAPAADAVAERAGVSVSSIFRTFDGLADVQQQAFELFNDRYAHLIQATPPADRDLASRTAFFVKTRLDLYEQAGPLMSLARLRALDDDTWRARIAIHRSELTAQLRTCFHDEIAALSPTAAADLVAVLDALTSPESYLLMTAAHARTRRQLTRSWHQSILTLTGAVTTS